MKYIPIIIILVLILAIIFAVYYAYCHITSSIREFSRSLFGTSNIKQAADRLRSEYSTTPKSVSAMTSLCLPRIKKDFPDFNYDEMKERAENVLVSYLRGISERNPSLLKDGNSELQQQLENYVAMLKGKCQIERYDKIRIHDTAITEYKKSAGRCSIIFQSAMECFHYVTDENDRVKEGSKDYKYQTKFNISMIYIQDRNIVENELDHALGLNCPNCGAPITSLGHKHCAYCGTPVQELNIHVWSFSDVKEVK